MEAISQFRAQVQQILDKECRVDWGKEGKYWGIISKYDASHPEAPWTIYYPRDGDEENGVFTPDFLEWHVEDEEHPKDPFTVRKILAWRDGRPTSLPKPPEDLDATEFEPVLGHKAELPHNQSSGSEGSGYDNDDVDQARSTDRSGRSEEEGASKDDLRARRLSAAAGSLSRQLSAPARLVRRQSGKQDSAEPEATLRRCAPGSEVPLVASQSNADDQQGGKRKPGRPRKHSLNEDEQPPAKRPRGRPVKGAVGTTNLRLGSGSAGAEGATAKDKLARPRKPIPADATKGKTSVYEAPSSGAALGGNARRSGSAEPAAAPKARSLVRLDSDELDDKQQDEKPPLAKGPVKASVAEEHDDADLSSSPSSDEENPRDGADAACTKQSKVEKSGQVTAGATAFGVAQGHGQLAKPGLSPDAKPLVGAGRPKPLLTGEQLAMRKLPSGTQAPPRPSGLLGIVPTARAQREAAHAGTVKLDGPITKPVVKALQPKPAGRGAGTGSGQGSLGTATTAPSKGMQMDPAADGIKSSSADAPASQGAVLQSDLATEASSPCKEQLDERPKTGDTSLRLPRLHQPSQTSAAGPPGPTTTPAAVLSQPSLPASLLGPVNSPPVAGKVSLAPLPVVSLPPRIASSASLAAAVLQQTPPTAQLSASPAGGTGVTATAAAMTTNQTVSQPVPHLPHQQHHDSQQQQDAPLSQSQDYQPGFNSQGSQREALTAAASALESPPSKVQPITYATSTVRMAHMPAAPVSSTADVAATLHASAVAVSGSAAIAAASLVPRPALPPVAALVAVLPTSVVATASLPAATSTVLPAAVAPTPFAPSAVTALTPATVPPPPVGAAAGGSAAEALSAAANAAIASGALPETANQDVQQLLNQLLTRALDSLTNSQSAIKSTANSAILMAKAVGANRVARGFFAKLHVLGEEVAVLAPEGCMGDATGCDRVAAVLAKRLNVFYVMDSMLQRSTKEEAISSWRRWVNAGLQASFRLKVFTEHHLRAVRKVTDVWKKRNLLDAKVLEMADLILREQESMLKSRLGDAAGRTATVAAPGAASAALPSAVGAYGGPFAVPPMRGEEDGHFGGAGESRVAEGLVGEGSAAQRPGQGAGAPHGGPLRRRRHCIVLPRPASLARFSYPMGEFEMYYINRFGPMANRCYIENPYGSMEDVHDETTGEPLGKLIEVSLSEDENEPDFSGTVTWSEVITVQLPEFNPESPPRRDGGAPAANVTPAHPALEDELRRAVLGLPKTPAGALRSNMAPKFLTPMPPSLPSSTCIGSDSVSGTGGVGSAGPVAAAHASASAPPANRPSGPAIAGLTPPANELEDFDTWAYGGEIATAATSTAEVSAAPAAVAVSNTLVVAGSAPAGVGNIRTVPAEEDVQPNIYDMPAAPSHEVASTGRRSDWDEMDMDMSDDEDGEWQPPLPAAPPPSLMSSEAALGGVAAPVQPLHAAPGLPPARGLLPGPGLAPISGLLQPLNPGMGMGAPDGLMAMMGHGTMGLPLGLQAPQFMMAMPPGPPLWPGQPPLPHPLAAPLPQPPLPPLPLQAPLPPDNPPPPLPARDSEPFPPPPHGPPSPPPPPPMPPPLPIGGSPPPLPPPIPAQPPLPPMPPIPSAGPEHSPPRSDDRHPPPLPPEASPQPALPKPALPPSPARPPPPLPSDGALAPSGVSPRSRTQLPPHLQATGSPDTSSLMARASAAAPPLPNVVAATTATPVAAVSESAPCNATHTSGPPTFQTAEPMVEAKQQESLVQTAVRSPPVPQSQHILGNIASPPAAAASDSTSGLEREGQLSSLNIHQRHRGMHTVREESDQDAGQDCDQERVRERDQERSKEEGSLDREGRERVRGRKEDTDRYEARSHKIDRGRSCCVASEECEQEEVEKEDWQQEREQAIARDRKPQSEASPLLSKPPNSSQHRERERDRDRDRDRDRGLDSDRVEKDSGRDRDRDRNRDRGREREKDKERDKDRERNKEREKDREKDRERERGREGGRGIPQREAERERDPRDRAPPRQQLQPPQVQPPLGGHRDVRRRYDDLARDPRDWPPLPPHIDSSFEQEWDSRDGERDTRDWDGSWERDRIHERERGGDLWDRVGPSRNSAGSRSRREPEAMRGGPPAGSLQSHSHPHPHGHPRGYREGDWEAPGGPLPPHMRGLQPSQGAPGRPGPGPGVGRPQSPTPHNRYGYRNSPGREPPLPPLPRPHSGDYAAVNGRGSRAPLRHGGGDPVSEPTYRDGVSSGYGRPSFSSQYGDEGVGGADDWRRNAAASKRPVVQAFLHDEPPRHEPEGSEKQWPHNRDRERQRKRELRREQRRERKKARQVERADAEREQRDGSRDCNPPEEVYEREEDEDEDDREEGEEGELPELGGTRAPGPLDAKDNRDQLRSNGRDSGSRVARPRGAADGAHGGAETEEGEVELPPPPPRSRQHGSSQPFLPPSPQRPRPNSISNANPRARDAAIAPGGDGGGGGTTAITTVRTVPSASTSSAPPALQPYGPQSSGSANPGEAQAQARKVQHPGTAEHAQEPTQASGQGQGQPPRKRNVITFNLAPRDSREGFAVIPAPMRLKAGSPVTASSPTATTSRPQPLLTEGRRSPGAPFSGDVTPKTALQSGRGQGPSSTSQLQQVTELSPSGRPPRAPLTLGSPQGGGSGGSGSGGGGAGAAGAPGRGAPHHQQRHARGAGGGLGATVTAGVAMVISAVQEAAAHASADVGRQGHGGKRRQDLDWGGHTVGGSAGRRHRLHSPPSPHR